MATTMQHNADLTGTFARTSNNKWGIRFSSPAMVANVGERVEIARRDGSKVGGIVGSLDRRGGDFCVYNLISTDDDKDGEGRPEVPAPVPAPVKVPQLEAKLKRGDILEKSINGKVLKVDDANVEILWDANKRRETIATGEVIDATTGGINLDHVDEIRAEYEHKLAQSAARVNALLDELEAAKGGIHEIVLKDAERGEVIKSTKGLFHEQFPKIAALVKARKNVFIYGPTGCGKSHICAQVAEALDMRFAFISCTAGMSEGQLTGRLLPIGDAGKFEYVRSEFVECYEEGGIFLLDEMDAADPNVLLIVNAALANGHLALPNRPENPVAKRHPDFVCIAAANTVGTGADRLYSGRNKLDAATLDRFAIGKVLMNYDERVESILCPDSSLRSMLQRYRKNIMAHRLERAMSTRFMRDAYDMMQAGWTIADVNEAFFQGWREDEISKVKNS